MPMLMSAIVDGGLYREDTFMLQGWFSPELIANRNRFVLTVGAIMVGVACLSMAMGVLAARCSAIATQGFARNMRGTLLGKIESFSFANIDHISTPQLITRATTDINTLRDTMRQSLVTLYRAPVMVILATVMSFIVSPRLAPLLLACIPLLAVVMTILLKVGQPRFKRMLKMMDGMNQAVRENLVASRVVKAYVRGGYESKRFDKTTDDLRQAQLGAGRLFTLSGPITMGIMWTCSVLILFFGGREIIFRTTGLLTGQLVSLVNYAGMAVNSLSMISWLVMSLSRAQASLVRINEVLDEEIDITDGPSGAAVESGSVDFEDVCFSYTRNPDKLALRRDHRCYRRHRRGKIHLGKPDSPVLRPPVRHGEGGRTGCAGVYPGESAQRRVHGIAERVPVLRYHCRQPALGGPQRHPGPDAGGLRHCPGRRVHRPVPRRV